MSNYDVEEVAVLSLEALGRRILEINTANGWNVPVPDDWQLAEDARNAGVDQCEIMCYKIPTSLALIHSEVSEALEEFRKGHDLQKFGEELADVVIRTLELGSGLGIDMDERVGTKLAKNAGRGYRHGGRLV